MKMLILLAMMAFLIAQALLDYRRGRRELAFGQRYWLVAIIALIGAYAVGSVALVAIAALFGFVGVVETRRTLTLK